MSGIGSDDLARSYGSLPIDPWRLARMRKMFGAPLRNAAADDGHSQAPLHRRSRCSRRLSAQFVMPFALSRRHCSIRSRDPPPDFLDTGIAASVGWRALDSFPNRILDRNPVNRATRNNQGRS